MDDTRQHTVRETVDTLGVSSGTLYLQLDNSSSAQQASAEQARCITRALLPISVDRTQAREGSLAVTDAVVRTVGGMRHAMMPALQEILTTEELTATTITAVREPPEVRDRDNPFPFEQWPRVADEELLDDQILLRVRPFTDSIGIWAGGGRETAAELHERFAATCRTSSPRAPSGVGNGVSEPGGLRRRSTWTARSPGLLRLGTRLAAVGGRPRHVPSGRCGFGNDS